MIPWLETIGILAVGALGAGLGLRCAHAGRRVWVLGYALALGFFVFCAVGARWPRLLFLPPFSVLASGRSLEVIKALAGAFLLAALTPRLPLARDRWVVGLAFGLAVLRASAWPFLAPAFNQTTLAGLTTQFDGDGVCRQNTTYTCGPAAAVTALRRLGLAADEGDLAMRCRTSDALGTPSHLLHAVLQAGYEPGGLVCEHRWLPRVEDLPRETPTIALMRFGWFVDHYVAVLERGPDRVVVGDPLLGRRELTIGEFEAQWRHVGIVLRRERRGSPRVTAPRLTLQRPTVQRSRGPCGRATRAA